MINLSKLTEEELKEAQRIALEKHISIQDAINNIRVQKVEL